MAELKSGSTIGGYTIWHRGNFDPATKLNANANAVSASKLETPRTISTTGDGTWSVSFDGTTNTTATLTLASTGVTAGTYKAVTVDVKGRVTTGLALTTGLVTSTTSAGTSNVNTTNTNTYLNVVETVGASPSSAGTSTQIIGAGTVTVTSDTGGKLTITGAQNITGNAGTATKLATARTINGVAFDGTANITVEDYTKLPTSGGTVTGALAVNGLLTANGGFKGHYVATDNRALKPNATSKGAIGAYFTSQGGLTGAGNAVYGDLLVLNSYGDTSGGNANALFFSKGGKSIFHYQTSQDATSWGAASQLAYVTDNVASATKLATARTINGVAFDGTANITVEDNTKLPLAGGTMSGPINFNLSHTEGAFHKLIEGTTVTDGGYIAVGNHGWDRGYVEIGTIDDGDTAIYARKRNQANGVIDEAVILSPDGHTSFPRSVNARTLGVNSTDGSGVGLSLYGGASNSMPEYGIAFAQTPNFGTHGGVVGDWATYFTMSGATNRGWIFKSGNRAGGNVASISANGVITGNQFKLTAIGDANYIANGNGDAASYSSHNMVIRSWWGIGFRDNQDVCRTVLDTRTGNFSTQGTVAAASVVASGSVQVGGAIQSASAVSFLNGGSAQTINTGGVLASYSYADAYKVPPQGIYSKGEIVTETGRFSAPSSAYHYIDLGRDGADRQIFGSYGAVYYFRNTINDADVVTINNGSISCVGSITAAGNVTAYSDERIKEDVTVIENALTKVEQLNGVTFKRKDTLDRQTGLLAQEVEAVLPEAVTHQEASEEIKAITGDEEVLAVNYGALTGLLVESIKELSDKLKAQQELIDKQAKLIENLLNKVSHT